MVERFRLGYANRTLGLRLPDKHRLAGADLRGRLGRLGIFRESGHEHFNGCVVFPVFDERGNVAEIYGRKIAQGLKPDLPRHLYLPGPHRGVWNLEAVKSSKEVILCEALIDALTFWCAGLRNVTSAYGIEGFTDEHLEVFRRYGTERVLIAYDRDDAGERAAQALARRLQAERIAPFRVLFPKGMDANEYAQKVQPAEKSLALVLRHAVWMGQGAAPALGVHKPPEEIAEATANGGDASSAVEASPAQEAESFPPLAAGRAGDPAASPATSTQPAPPPRVQVPVEIRAEEVVLTLGDRRFRVRGLEKNLSYEQLRVNVLVARGEAFHVDTLDLYSARQRAVYVKQAVEELQLKEEVLRKDLGKVLLKLEELQDEQIRRALEPATPRVEMTEPQKAAALELLGDPQLLDRILEDFARCGVVGEETNKLVGYLAAVSRKLDEPLAVILQSSSAAGKSSLMEAILAFAPEEERVQYSAMTGQSLFYMGEADLKHKVLAIVEEEGAERASYALKLLQSEGELTIASTGKDPATGRLVTHEYRVEGPVGIFLTTTAVEVDEELLNRCLVLTVNEDRDQTRRIHELQRESQTLEGLLARQDREEVLRVHRNAQRLLRPLLVANPYARELTFLDARTRTRRDHVKYLTLIRTIALLHQHQRPLRTVVHRGKTLHYIEVELADIETANRLAHEVLGRSLDELPPQTRRFLELLDGAVRRETEPLKVERPDFFFASRWVRERTGWGHTQVKIHLARLVDLEYVLVHRGGRGQSFVYELLYDGAAKDRDRFLPGLLDVERLGEHVYDANRSGSEARWSGDNGRWSAPGRPPVGPESGGGRGEEIAAEPSHGRGLILFADDDGENAHLEEGEAAAVVATPRTRSRRVSPLAAGGGGGR